MQRTNVFIDKKRRIYFFAIFLALAPFCSSCSSDEGNYVDGIGAGIRAAAPATGEPVGKKSPIQEMRAESIGKTAKEINEIAIVPERTGSNDDLSVSILASLPDPVEKNKNADVIGDLIRKQAVEEASRLQTRNTNPFKTQINMQNSNENEQHDKDVIVKNAVRRESLNSLIKTIKINIESSVSDLRHDEVLGVVYELLDFLLDRFGSPPNKIDTLYLNITKNIGKHAFVKVLSPSERSMSIDSLNLYDKQKMYVAHELFHAFFQDEHWFKLDASVVEGWATYAQYLFYYKDLDNASIKRKLMEMHGIGEGEIHTAFSDKLPWSALGQAGENRRYIISALRIFTKDHNENYNYYRQISARSVEPAQGNIKYSSGNQTR